MKLLDYVIIGDSLLLTLLILVQVRGASVGAGLGGGGEVYNVRRGSDKTLHQFTIVCVVVFVAAIIASVVS